MVEYLKKQLHIDTQRVMAYAIVMFVLIALVNPAFQWVHLFGIR